MAEAVGHHPVDRCVARVPRPGWIGEASTDEIYGNYLRATDETPVSRERFVADLAYLGIEEVLDDETHLLLRP